MIVTDRLIKKKLIVPPIWLKDNIQYEVMMGSVAYGVSTDMSDRDIYGFCIPPKDMVFPHLRGEINGFGKQLNRIDQFQQHHIKEEEVMYDISIYSIIKYFHLCMLNNPNMIDSLFVPQRCVLYSTSIGDHVRNNRKLFLHKGAWFKFKGYAYSQINKLKNKYQAATNLYQFEKNHNIEGYQLHEVKKKIDEFLDSDNDKTDNSQKVIDNLTYNETCNYKELLSFFIETQTKRTDETRKYGYSVKFAYHTVRLLNEIEQILTEGDLDLERNREQLKSIRRGEWSLDEIFEYFKMKEQSLELLYSNCTLRHSPDEPAIKNLLLECLEMHYGSLTNIIATTNSSYITQLINDISIILNKYK